MRWPLAAVPLALSFGACAALQTGSAARPETPADLAYLAQSDGYWQVWVAAADGSAARPVTNSPVDKLGASWFPASAELLVNTQDGALVRVDVTHGSERAVAVPFSGIRDAALSPDGRRIAFSLTQSDSPDANEIWTCDLDGSAARQITHREHPQQGPAWDSSGVWIYYDSSLGPGVGHDLWRASADGAKDERLTFAGAYRLDVAVARDGAIAYSANEAGPYDLWVKLPEKPPLRLTADAAADSHPAFFLDGEVIFFESTRDGRPNIWRISRDGGAPSQITRLEGAGARRPAPRPVGISQ